MTFLKYLFVCLYFLFVFHISSFSLLHSTFSMWCFKLCFFFSSTSLSPLLVPSDYLWTSSDLKWTRTRLAQCGSNRRRQKREEFKCSKQEAAQIPGPNSELSWRRSEWMKFDVGEKWMFCFFFISFNISVFAAISTSRNEYEEQKKKQVETCAVEVHQTRSATTLTQFHPTFSPDSSKQKIIWEIFLPGISSCRSHGSCSRVGLKSVSSFFLLYLNFMSSSSCWNRSANIW